MSFSLFTETQLAMSNSIPIKVATTWISFPCTNLGYVTPTVGVKFFINRELSEREWVPHANCWVYTQRYIYYDRQHSEMVMPRYVLSKLQTFLSNNQVSTTLIEVPPILPHKVKINLRKKFQPREGQQELIDFLIDQDNGFKPLSAQCGQGKTYCTINAASQLGYPVLVILGGLIDQWYKSLRQYTTLAKSDIYVVQGFQPLKDLWEMIANGYRPKVVLFSTRTLSLYAVKTGAPYDQLPSYDEFQRRIGFGVLVHDETHLKFHANTQIDLRSNIEHNIFLSATYQRSDPHVNRIFNSVFPPEKLFGDHLAQKYTAVHVVRYSLGIPSDVTARFSVAKGYLHAKYESWLLTHRQVFGSFLEQILLPLIRIYFITKSTPDQKLLILCQTRDFALALTDQLRKALNESSISPYFSGDAVYGDRKILKSRIIISTIMSGSTGLDIPDLKTCINTVSFSSPPQAAQCLGRLRRLPGEETIYVDIWNGDIDKHYHHMRNRLEVYRLKALRCDEIRM